MQEKVVKEFNEVIEVFGESNLDYKTALLFISTNLEFLRRKREGIKDKLFLIMNKKELCSVLYINNDSYLWSTYDEEEFLPFKSPSKLIGLLPSNFEDNDSIVERVLSYTDADKIKEAIPEIEDMNVENKVKTLKNIGLNSNGYHIK